MCCAAIVAAAQDLGFVPADSRGAYPNRAFFEGREVEFTTQHSRIPGRDFKLGPWDMGVRVTGQKPKNSSPNMYLLVPGAQFERSGAEEYNHTRILSYIPTKKDDSVQWDVYWAIIVDPTLVMEYRSERELLVAAQEDFRPADDFKFESIPAHAVLRDYLKIRSLPELDKFRKSDGTLPGIIIVPAGFKLRGTAWDVTELPPAEAAEKTRKSNGDAASAPQ